jgi:hypothetical protein
MSAEPGLTPMTVTVTYNLADMYGAILHGWPRLLRILIILEIFWIVLFVGFDVANGTPLFQAMVWLNWKILGILGLAVVAVWFIVCPLIGYFRTKRAGVLGPNRFTLVDKGIRLETANADSTVYWPAVKRTVHTKSRFYLYLVTAGAIIVPRRAFDSEAGFHSFADAARRRWSDGAQR